MVMQKSIGNATKATAVAAACAITWQTAIVQTPPSPSYDIDYVRNKDRLLPLENYSTSKQSTIKSNFVFLEDGLLPIIQSVYGKKIQEVDVERAPGDAIGYFYVYDEDKSFNENKIMLKRLQKKLREESLPYAALIG